MARGKLIAIIAISLIIVLLIGLGVYLIVQPGDGSTSSPSPTLTTLESIEIATPLTRITKGMSKEDVFESFTYRINYSNGTYSQYDSTTKWYDRLSCSPEYDPEVSGVTYTFSVTHLGIQSNLVTLTVPAEPCGLVLSVLNTQIPHDLSEASFLGLLTVGELMTDGTTRPYEGDWSVVYLPEYSADTPNSTFSVSVVAGEVTSNSVEITVLDAVLESITLGHVNGTSVAHLTSYDGFLSGVVVKAQYSGDIEITVPLQEVTLTCDNYSSHTQNSTFTLVASYKDKSVSMDFTVSSAHIVSIEVENSSTLYVVVGTLESDILPELGQITGVYSDGSRAPLSVPDLHVLKKDTDEKVFGYNGQIDEEYDLQIQIAYSNETIKSEKIRMIVVPDVDVYYPTMIPKDATVDDVAKFVGIKHKGSVQNGYLEYTLRSDDFNSGALNQQSTFVVEYANVERTFTVTVVDAKLELSLKENEEIYPGLSIADVTKKFQLKVVAGEQHEWLKSFELTTDYTPEANGQKCSFSVSFGNVESNVVKVNIPLEYNGVTFNGIDENNPLVVEYGATDKVIKDALDIYLTLDGQPVGDEISVMSSSVKFGAPVSCAGGDGKRNDTPKTMSITVNDLPTQLCYIVFEEEDQNALGTAIYFDDQGYRTETVGGQTIQAFPESGSKLYKWYYYGIEGVPEKVYLPVPSGNNYVEKGLLLGVDSKFAQAKAFKTEYSKYFGYYLKYINGFINVEPAPEMIGKVNFSMTYYHSLCGILNKNDPTSTVIDPSSPIFNARVKMKVEKINTTEEITVEDLKVLLFENQDVISIYNEGMNTEGFNTKFIFSEVDGPISVGDEIWIDVIGDHIVAVNPQ